MLVCLGAVTPPSDEPSSREVACLPWIERESAFLTFSIARSLALRFNVRAPITHAHERERQTLAHYYPRGCDCVELGREMCGVFN